MQIELKIQKKIVANISATYVYYQTLKIVDPVPYLRTNLNFAHVKCIFKLKSQKKMYQSVHAACKQLSPP